NGRSASEARWMERPRHRTLLRMEKRFGRHAAGRVRTRRPDYSTGRALFQQHPNAGLHALHLSAPAGERPASTGADDAKRERELATQSAQEKAAMGWEKARQKTSKKGK